MDKNDPSRLGTFVLPERAVDTLQQMGVEVESGEVLLTYGGTLKDYGLGRKLGEGGIESGLNGREALETAAQLLNYMRPVEPPMADGARKLMCSDGRWWQQFADGSKPDKAYSRLIGGTLGIYVPLLVAEPLIVQTLPENLTPDAMFGKLDEVVKELGYCQCTHRGCGCAKKLVQSLEVMSERPVDLARAIQGLPELQGIAVRAELEKIAPAAGRLANDFRKAGWDGDAYVSRIEASNPSAVAILEEDHHHPLHGHNEKVTLIVHAPGCGLAVNETKAAGLPQAFVVNSNVVQDVALGFAGAEKDVQRRLAAAAVAFPVAVLDGLAAEDMPLVHAAFTPKRP